MDCHLPVLDGDRFPFAAKRSYIPGPATVADLRAFHAGLGVDRIVSGVDTAGRRVLSRRAE